MMTRLKFIALGIGTILSLFCVFALRAQTTSKVVFVGKVDPRFDGTKIYLYNNITGDNDTATVTKGAWQIERPFTVATRHMLAAEAESKKHGGYAPFGILVDAPATIHIAGDLESFYTSKVSGSNAHDVLNQYFTLMQTKGADEAAVITQVVAQNNNSFGAAFLLDRYGKAMKPEEALKVYEGLTPAIKQSYYGKSAGNQIRGALLSKEGALVANFSLPNENGQKIDFASMKGSYVLLDFWASWCGPCIEEFKTLKEIYGKYKGKSAFEILSISTDKSENAWKNMLKTQQLPWIQLHDIPADNSIAVSRFAVTALPTTFLIDPNGKILAKNLRGEELKAYLVKLFGY
ncbi:TlpA family protein disulfide reductase [Sphingobacterium sp. E70]|uniref:TlpA family protein disulfide reductase n=1 Tax=Sphingobacterium sp. E70 TaxID=2853439 RepID=UPI00211C18B1|nr:TlpA disulfide reductase family protein [Sphingobacterium sp. E70]ULT28315.1 TlpA family protein disulfide reductase [Sphingobacterium sp. E70]